MLHNPRHIQPLRFRVELRRMGNVNLGRFYHQDVKAGLLVVALHPKGLNTVADIIGANHFVNVEAYQRFGIITVDGVCQRSHAILHAYVRGISATGIASHNRIT